MPPGAHGPLGTLWSGYVGNLGQVMPTGGLFLEDEQGLSWAERGVSLLEKEEGEGTEAGLRLAREWPLEPADSPSAHSPSPTLQSRWKHVPSWGPGLPRGSPHSVLLPVP